MTESKASFLPLPATSPTTPLLHPPEPATDEILFLSPEDHLGSPTRTFGNVIISILGAGILGLPYAFSQSGWALGVFTVCMCAAMSYYCMLLLVRCRQRLEERGVDGVHSYSDVGQHAAGDLGRRLADALVLLSQGGCCVSYLLFMGQNLASIGDISWASRALVIFLLAPFEVLLAWMPSLTSLAPFSIFADITNFVAMGVVIKDGFVRFEADKDVAPFTGWTAVPFALGVAVYCYEGFAMTLPLEASMKDRSKFPITLASGMTCLTALYVTFGLVGYLAFGDATQEIVTLNLPNDWATAAVKIGLCIGLFFTFPVMLHPVHDIFEYRLRSTRLFNDHVEGRPIIRQVIMKVLRFITVFLVAFLAAEVPGFASLCSLLGATVCAMLAFVLPAVFYSILFKGEIGVLQMGVNGFLVLFGVLFAAYGTCSTLSDLSW